MDILEKPVEMKPYFSDEVKSLLTGLLQKDPQRRLGGSDEDAEEIKRHPFFKNIEWEKLYKKEV
jgi:serine/threonine protein kinase